MTTNELKQRFPNASNAFLKANAGAGGLLSSPKPERTVRDEPMAKAEGEVKNAARIFVRINSKRRRLLDPDNVCPKYFIDALRYAKIIPGDRDADIRLEVRQEKVASKSEECTVIELMEQARP